MDEEDLLDRMAVKERLIQIMATERTRDRPHLRDDAINEARIAVWEVLLDRPDVPTEYLTATMRMRINEVLTRDNWFGKPSLRGSQRPPVVGSLDDPDASFVVEAEDVLDGIFIAYHRGEIMQALNSLDARQRAYVYHRFWGGLTNPEIGALLEVSKQRLEAIWRTEIRPALARELEHLVRT